jgi:hypothetical protein
MTSRAQIAEAVSIEGRETALDRARRAKPHE